MKGYSTAAEMMLEEYPDKQRNSPGNYKQSLARVQLDEELRKLFEAQRGFGSSYAGLDLEAEIRGTGDRKSGLFWAQKPLQSVLHMVGKCTFEKDEERAPKASFSAERQVWLTKLVNMRIVSNGQVQSLTPEQVSAALPIPYFGPERLTFASFKNAMIQKGMLPEDTSFAGLNSPRPGRNRRNNPEIEMDPEQGILVELKGWHHIRKALGRKNLEDVWQQISTDALGGKPEQLDSISRVLSIYKDEDEVRKELISLQLPYADAHIDALMHVRFDKFHSLSIKALRKIVPEMEKGLRYDEAVKETEYRHHSQFFVAGSGRHKYLPSFYEVQREYKTPEDRVGSMRLREGIDFPRNPLVLKALNKARKVVNALIAIYGSPQSVHIELARELSKSKKERKDIADLQKEYKDKKNQIRKEFEARYKRFLKPGEEEKLRLYEEQGGICAYSLRALDLDRIVNEIGYVEIDHCLPFSRSHDDSKNNKVLVLLSENANKGTRTAYEYLTRFEGGEDGERWRSYKDFVERNRKYSRAKRAYLLRKNFGPEEEKEFSSRNLNDTRYICTFFKSYVEENLLFAKDSDGCVDGCVSVNGKLTAFLRMKWGLLKLREENDRHHAMDAVVVAACSRGMVKRLSDYSRREEIKNLSEGMPDPETGEVRNREMASKLERQFPTPWPNFRNEVELRLKTNDLAELREKLGALGTYDEQALEAVRCLFVARSPERLGTGAAHRDTVYAKAPEHGKPHRVTQVISLSDIKRIEDVDQLVDQHRNRKLYAAIRLHLQKYVEGGGKFKTKAPDAGNKAFPESDPIRQQGPKEKNGKLVHHPIVRKVKIAYDNMSGLDVRGGLVKREDAIRVDVFTSKKTKKHHLVPIYVHHLATDLPCRAIVAKKDESEWLLMDADFEFSFSLYPGDFIKIKRKEKIITGYYVGCDRSDASITIRQHDISGEKGNISGIGVMHTTLFEKLNVDILGRIYKAKLGVRRGLA